MILIVLIINRQILWVHLNNHTNEDCPVLCDNVKYDSRLSKLGKNALSDKENINKTMLYAMYASPKVKIEEEYMLMGTIAMISATGGSLGLFLGFSCYGAIWNIFEMAEAAFHPLFIPGGNRKAKNTRAFRKR